jgi:hypothetical protein
LSLSSSSSGAPRPPPRGILKGSPNFVSKSKRRLSLPEAAMRNRALGDDTDGSEPPTPPPPPSSPGSSPPPFPPQGESSGGVGGVGGGGPAAAPAPVPVTFVRPGGGLERAPSAVRFNVQLDVGDALDKGDRYRCGYKCGFIGSVSLSKKSPPAVTLGTFFLWPQAPLRPSAWAIRFSTPSFVFDKCVCLDVPLLCLLSVFCSPCGGPRVPGTGFTSTSLPLKVGVSVLTQVLGGGGGARGRLLVVQGQGRAHRRLVPDKGLHGKRGRGGGGGGGHVRVSRPRGALPPRERQQEEKEEESS